MNENEISKIIVDAAIEVHRELGGPGLVEEVYEEAMAEELRLRGIFVERQRPVPITYKGRVLRHPLRLDMRVERLVLVDNKAVIQWNPVFKAQMLTYLRLTKLKLGFVINFGERVVNGLPEEFDPKTQIAKARMPAKVIMAKGSWCSRSHSRQFVVVSAHAFSLATVLTLTWIAGASFANNASAAEPPKAPVPKSPYIAVVYRYADTLLEKGRDPSGFVLLRSGPYHPHALDQSTLVLLDERQFPSSAGCKFGPAPLLPERVDDQTKISRGCRSFPANLPPEGRLRSHEFNGLG
jgi:GxxExxY protein